MSAGSQAGAANGWLVAAGVGSVAAAVLHLAAIVGGPGWYRAFGAGERIARMAEAGWWTPPLLTMGIAAILLGWAAYAFAGAGLIPRLPLMRTALAAITLVLIVRGMALFWPGMLRRNDLTPAFIAWSSGIVLMLGILYAVGTWRAWPSLVTEGR